MGMMDYFNRVTGQTNSEKMGQKIEEMVTLALIKRRRHERRWYDNTFFDDGYHFRIVSPKTGRVIDTVQRNNGFVERAIPRASRQIRGVTNLLFAAEPYPVVYPERIIEDQYGEPIQDPKTGKMMPNPEYQQALEKAKETARLRGIWLSTEWEENQELPVKLIQALLLSMKHGVSWLQVSSDTDNQEIITNVYDAFDVICYGEMDDENKLPFITKAAPRDFDEVRYDARFPEDARRRLVPDNKYETSEIKNAYMRTRFGNKTTDKEGNTIIQKETYLKEVLTDENWKQAVKLGQDTGAMDGKSKGDLIMRRSFSAGNVSLYDIYIDYDNYPLGPIRMVPGPLYQVPYTERFLP